MKTKQSKFFDLFVMTFAVTFLIFIVFPKGRELYELKKKIELTNLKILNGKRALMHRETLEKEVEVRKTLLARIRGLFIMEDEQPKVYQILNETAKRTGVFVASLKPQPQDMSEDIPLGSELVYRVLPVRLEIEGEYSSIARFVDAITHAAKYFSVQGIECEARTDQKEKIKAVLMLNEHILKGNES
jgi:Tfp pilus assembly protein PilO